ncbi:MAG: prepilin-type N-terminal cleavage/methylation domain-containing protein [Candidatus Pacebacteria bacterium]|nr:prepilin-type N-terminal cleavage/methylation domain-containing protein [Candidatus Paceibacterota bacterium]
MKNKLQKGMTFLELLIAMFILTVGISGVSALLHTTISASNDGVLRLQAAYLAGEGVEIVRNIRDDNLLNHRNWLTGIPTDCSYCEVAYNTRTLTERGSIDNLNELVYIDAEYSIFKRGISITDHGDYIEVESTVYWWDNSLTVKNHLYNWR